MWLFAGDEYLRFLGDRALETLVKQLAEMSLFVKHVADKHFPIFLWRYFPRNLGEGISVANALGPRDPKRISCAE